MGDDLRNIAAKHTISALSKERYVYLDEYENSWDKFKEEYSIEENHRIDELSKIIYHMLKINQSELSFEFIIEELTKLGDAPCLLYDDNGHFVINGEGMQSINTEVSDSVITHFVDKKDWKPTIREALEDYLNDN